MEIFLQKNGEKEGPFSVEQIQQRLDAGTLSKTSLAWSEGCSNWMPVLAVLTPRAKPPAFKPEAEEVSTAPVVQKAPEPQDQKPATIPAPDPNVTSPALADGRSTDEFLSRRTSAGTQFAEGLGQLQKVGWAAILPIKAFREDKPWNLLWVRWLLLLSCIPCSLVYLSSSGHATPLILCLVHPL